MPETADQTTGWTGPAAEPEALEPELGPEVLDPDEVDLDPRQELEHPRTTWCCENSKCEHFGVERSVPWAHLGQGLYLVGTVKCACRQLPIRVTVR
jgi:hypothetical protein